jgi:hypothetical protein
MGEQVGSVENLIFEHHSDGVVIATAPGCCQYWIETSEEMNLPQMQHASKFPQEGDKGIFVPKSL